MNTAAGAAAQGDADAIIERLGLGGDEDLPSNPAELVSRIESAGNGEDDKTGETDPGTATDKGTQPQADSSAATETKDDKTAAAATTGTEEPGKTTEPPAGVLLKDGKHFLPYEKHAEERRLRMEAENRNKQLEAEVQALKEGKGQQPNGEGKGDLPDSSTGTLEGDLAVIDELEAKAKAYEAEGLTELAATTAASAKMMRSMATQLQKLGSYVTAAQAREAEDQTRSKQTVDEQIAQAIDNNPKLRYLQDTMGATPANAEMWDMVADQDALLRSNPKFKDMSFGDRFAKALQMVEAINGEIKLPVEYQTVASVKAAAEDKAKGATEFQPRTLSDLPGGGMPRGGDQNEFGNLDVSQMERLMDDASPDKLAEMLARVPG